MNPIEQAKGLVASAFGCSASILIAAYNGYRWYKVGGHLYALNTLFLVFLAYVLYRIFLIVWHNKDGSHVPEAPEQSEPDR